MKYCEICGRAAEEHHIVFRSQASYMVEVELNKKYLCPEHHRGNDSPHGDRKIDVKYKLELQSKLFEIFSKEYYKASEIKELLGLSDVDLYKFIKTLNPVGDKGFKRFDVVLRCMGDKLYGN